MRITVVQVPAGEGRDEPRVGVAHEQPEAALQGEAAHDEARGVPTPERLRALGLDGLAG